MGHARRPVALLVALAAGLLVPPCESLTLDARASARAVLNALYKDDCELAKLHSKQELGVLASKLQDAQDMVEDEEVRVPRCVCKGWSPLVGATLGGCLETLVPGRGCTRAPTPPSSHFAHCSRAR